MTRNPSGSTLARRTTFGGVPSWLPAPSLISFGLFVALWWIASLEQPAYILPSPAAVWESFAAMAIETDRLWQALSITIVSLLIGAGLALAVGVTLGMLMGAQRRVEQAFDLYVNALYVAPVSALTPLFIYWLGIDLAPRVATVFVFALPQIVITCFRGARSTPSTYLQVARAFRASRRQVFTKVLIPHEVPYIVTSIRLGVGAAIKGAVLAELLVSSTGLGRLLHGYSQVFDTASLIAVLIALMVLGILATAVVARFERAISPWRNPA
jgi:NitT/TauT family transport system permease protein